MVYHPFRHLGLKFLSIGIAVLIWLSVAGEQIVDRSVRAPLEIMNTPAGLELIEFPPQTVDVRVRGSSSVLSELGAGSIVGVLDLSSAKEGLKTFSLSSQNISAPFGISVVQVLPSTITLRFERTATSVVPVRIVLHGDPAAGFVATHRSVDPARVTVVGPGSAVKDLKEALAELSIQDARQSVKDRVALRVPDPVRFRDRADEHAVVTVGIEPEPVERTMAGVPVRLTNAPPRGADVEPPTVSVRLTGRTDLVGVLRGEDLVVFVDLAGLARGRYNLPVRVVPQQGLEILRTEPATVSIRVK
jgi:YbbR domain-containing protein